MSACVSANAGDCRFSSEKPETMVCGSRSFQFFPFALYYVFVHMGYPFQGNHHYTADTLVRYLDTQDVRYGMKKKKINCEELEAGMREAFPQITWVSARVSGTRLVIQIKENKIIQAKTTVKEDPCDLVSDVTGTITYIMVRQGIPKVKKEKRSSRDRSLSVAVFL